MRGTPRRRSQGFWASAAQRYKPGTGLDIVYENIEDYHIEDFSDHLQGLKEYEEVSTELYEYLLKVNAQNNTE